MKIHIHSHTPLFFKFMQELMEYSILDLGYELTDADNADVIISIQRDDHEYKSSHPEKKYILLQIEDWINRPASCPDYTPYPFDKTWVFDINDPYGDYFYLGYHEKMEVKNLPMERYNVGFLGGMHERRKIFFGQSKHQTYWIGGWDYDKAVRECAKCRIQVHVHCFKQTMYTPWDRYSRFLHNKIFILSEKCYCPLKIPMFDIGNYDSAVDLWLKSDKQRREIVNDLYEDFKTNYDMTKQMEEKLKGFK